MNKIALALLMWILSSSSLALDVSLRSINGVVLGNHEFDSIFNVQVGVAGDRHRVYFNQGIILTSKHVTNVGLAYEYKIISQDLWSSSIGAGFNMVSGVREYEKDRVTSTSNTDLSASINWLWLDRLGIQFQVSERIQSAGFVITLM